MDDIEAELNAAEGNLDHEASSEDERCRRSVQTHSFSHVPHTRGSRRETGFHRSTRLCLKAIRNALLHHHWREAAQYLASYCQTLEETTVDRQILACEIIWRLGSEVLQHHPNSRLEDFNALYERMKNSGVKNYAKICLEHSFHLMLHGQFPEAKRQLAVSMSWRYGKQQETQSLDLKLIRAYCGFLNYLVWCTKRSSEPEVEHDVSSREMHNCFRQASVTLQEIIAQPGIWDTFVLSYVDMLEFYDDQDGALKVLQDYAYNKDQPPNPNAHVYLYQFLKKHNAPAATQLSTLKILHSLVPSHDLMLEYCSLLLNTEKGEDLKEALTIAMNLLEYTSWRSNLNAWNCLFKVLQCLKKRDLKHLIEEEWKQRSNLWMALHYKKYNCRRDLDNVELLQVKTKVIRLLGGHKICYVKMYSEVCVSLGLGRKSKRVYTKKKSGAQLGVF